MPEYKISTFTARILFQIDGVDQVHVVYAGRHYDKAMNALLHYQALVGESVQAKEIQEWRGGLIYGTTAI